MEISLTPVAAVSLFSAMMLLAAQPSVSVMTVVGCAAGGGFRSGAQASLGIVLGDLLFILLAALGLRLTAGLLGDWLFLFQAGAGCYLLWCALARWRSSGRPDSPPDAFRSAFLTGLLVTLGDQKAILFYFGFLPAFVAIDQLGMMDILIIMFIAVIAVGGIKLLFAAATARGRALLADRNARRLSRITAAVLCGAGLVLLARATSVA